MVVRLAALRELPLTLTNLSTGGALSQPIWDNLHFTPWSISQLHRDRWESLQVTVLHNLYSDREGKVPFTQEDNEKYIDTENNYHYFQNKKINNERFLNSWEMGGDSEAYKGAHSAVPCRQTKEAQSKGARRT
jgi:hypothetical protein